jgi:hypothetical protein
VVEQDRVAVNKTFMFTNNLALVVAPELTVVGDQLWIIKDVKVPLTAIEGSGRFILVGPSQCHEREWLETNLGLAWTEITGCIYVPVKGRQKRATLGAVFGGKRLRRQRVMTLATRMTVATSLVVPKQAGLYFQPIDWHGQNLAPVTFR